VSVQDEAAAWFARWRSGAMTSEETAAFEAWRLQHQAAFDDVQRLWDGIEGARAHPAVLAMREKALRSPNRRIIAAASVLLAVCAAWAGAHFGLRALLQPAATSTAASEYQTRVGQKSTITLPDGSVVILDADSSIRTLYSAQVRRVTLERGRAYFRVVKNAERPFTVSAGGNTVTALGTEFDVELKPRAFEVMLVSGRVRVQGVPQGVEVPAVEMTSGFRLVASENHQWNVSRADARSETGWLEGRLVFDEETLVNIASALNRYSTKKIEITDPAVAERRLSAVLTAGDIETFIAAAQKLGLASIGRDDGHSVQLLAPGR
jgi:transmembrane sensor